MSLQLNKTYSTIELIAPQLPVNLTINVQHFYDSICKVGCFTEREKIISQRNLFPLQALFLFNYKDPLYDKTYLS